MDIREVAKLTRIEHGIMLAFGVLIAETMVLGRMPPPEVAIILSLLVPLFSELGSFALNDYLDIETDRLNKKTDRPLVSGTISPAFALWFSIITLAVSTILALFINSIAFAIAVVFNILAIGYNLKLKDLPLMGNVYIALTMAIPFIFGNFVVSESLSLMAGVVALLAFIAGLAREIVKSVEDMEGDLKARGSRTLPVVIGSKNSLMVATALYLIFIPLSISPFLLGLGFSLIPAILIAGADLLLVFISYNIIAKNAFRMARNYSLVAFLLGMLGLLAAAV